MRKRLKHFLKDHPGLYKIVEYLYCAYRKIQFNVSGSGVDEKYWAKRHLNNWENKKNDWGDEKKDWIESYWNSVHHTHRKFLIDKISAFDPVSILEIGCNCGPNLRLLAEKFPYADITGIDINPMAIQKGSEWFKSAGLKNVRLFECKADELERFNDQTFDVVFTDAVLIYFGPDKIKEVIGEMIRVSAKAIILMEWNDFSAKSDPLGKYVKHWIRDYKGLLKQFVSEDAIRIEKLPENLWPSLNWKKYGALIEATIRKN